MTSVPADGPPLTPWWVELFDEHYGEFWEPFMPAERTRSEARLACRLFSEFGVPDGGRVLDAPCGMGRLSAPLAAYGYDVTGLDQSGALVRRARESYAATPRLAFTRGDIVTYRSIRPFHAALNWFTSLGYSEHGRDDLAALKAIRTNLVADGVLLIETDHLEHLVANFVDSYDFVNAAGRAHGIRSFDERTGTFREAQVLERGGRSLRRSLRIRIYTVSQLVALCERAGFRVEAVLDDAGTGEPGPATRLLLVIRA